MINFDKENFEKYIDNYFPIHKVYEDYLYDLFAKFNSNSIVFELGVNRFQDTYRLLKLLNVSTFYGFEPDHEHLKFIKNIQQTFPNFKLIEKAVGAFDGEVDFYSSWTKDDNKEINTGSSSFRKPMPLFNKYWPHIYFKETYKVPIIKLDTFCANHGIEHIDFIWADIQGCEIDMIKGGKKILNNTDYLFTEYSNNEIYQGQADLKTILNELPGNWEIIKDYVSDVLLRRIKK